MIYTVTFNPALDYVMKVEKLRYDDINRTYGEELYYGGKGINVSVILSRLGMENTALGFKAGFTGEKLEELLKEEGINTDFIALKSGMTRINVKIKAETELDINAVGPPIEREDIVSLSQNIDNVTDKVEDILLRVYMNNVSRIGEDALAMMDVVVQCCEAVRELLQEFADFRRSKNLKKVIIRINDLEEAEDKLFMTSMRKLYIESKDPIHIIAWREIYIYLERCADACEHVADVVESIIMKNS